MYKSINLLGVILLLGCILSPSTFSTVPNPSDVQGYIGTEVHFSWGESTGEVAGYRIYWGESEGGPYPNRLCEVNGLLLNYNASLNNVEQYYLVCRAYNQYGESGNSNEVIWPAQ